ncbi:MAG: HAD-IC family P-type ATPase [Candidatus Peribacteraceae bacterium]|nr:HAD-IC family P-type ATPase [Candidatus Peribacteraceae bacterium]MDD5742288.1 HAD-IC family P-type ATPase [Candidatus Peribacteraceae bacterium]
MNSQPEKLPPSPDPFAQTTWHTMTVEETLEALHTPAQSGLGVAEAARRLKAYGVNELRKTDGISPWKLLFGQLKNVLIIILLIAIVLSAILGHEIEAITIGIIVVFAVLLGFVQEYRAERAIDALRKMAAPLATVLRGGEEKDIPAKDIVPGDVISLIAGNRIPADGRVMKSVNLHADEASLTGESVPVAKGSEPMLSEKPPIGDRHNMLFAGTAITYGRGTMVVTATGMQTEFGKIAQMLETVKEGATPLQRNLDEAGKRLAQWAGLIVALVAMAGIVRGQPVLDMVIFGVALAVAVVPEALPAVVTISLAIGVQRMVKRHALIRHLPAVETLGSTSVICTDKTGTLTKDEMTVRRILAAGETYDVTGSGYNPQGEFRQNGIHITPPAALCELLRAAVLASDTRLVRGEGGVWEIKGDPTEGALVVAAAKAGVQKDQEDERNPRTAEVPFTSESKRMVTLHQTPQGAMAFAKGAPEVIVEACTMIRTSQGTVAFSLEEKARVLDTARAMADDALRLIAVAVRETDDIGATAHGMTFLGLVGMIDPPRPEAQSAVHRCEEAGIRVVMITGDHPITAQAVAKELGILRGNRVLTGNELDVMSDTELASIIGKIDVFARVSPAHKLRVVTALQHHGRIVAMTGDGVNDAPALKKADVGIAMGISGTDVSREAADMMLTDDNFASIVAAVEEGRAIFGNIKKYLMYLLSSNIGELFLMVGASVLGTTLPLSAVQILYVNLVTDGLPALALAVDPPERDLMRRPPRNPKGTIFNRPVVFLMLLGGIWSAAVNLGLFFWAFSSGRSTAEAMTMTFLSLVLIQFFKAYNFRSDRHSVLRRPFANRWLNIAIFSEILLLIATVYWPVLQHPFGTFAVTAQDWIIILALAASVIPVLEIGKWMIRRGPFGMHT